MDSREIWSGKSAGGTIRARGDCLVRQLLETSVQLTSDFLLNTTLVLRLTSQEQPHMSPPADNNRLYSVE